MASLFIHPDGNMKGTQGCIVVVEHDTQEFWELWRKTATSSRPTRLLVSGGAHAKHPTEH
jgi:hypothetical protein